MCCKRQDSRIFLLNEENTHLGLPHLSLEKIRAEIILFPIQYFPPTRFCSPFSGPFYKEHLIKWEGSFAEHILRNRNLLILTEILVKLCAFDYCLEFEQVSAHLRRLSPGGQPIYKVGSWFSTNSSYQEIRGEM